MHNPNRHKNRSILPELSINIQSGNFLDQTVLSDLLNFDNGNTSKVFVSLLLVQYKYQCFSDWDKNQLKLYWEFQKRLHEMTWQQVLSSASKNKKNKTGVCYTIIPKSRYPNQSFVGSLSKDISLFELRINGRIRVHGFRLQSVFYLCWLDKDHQICPD